MNRKNKRKNATRRKCGYLTTKEQKVVAYYKMKRVDAKQRVTVMNDGK
ncbi:hypothetical protein [Niallia sp. 03133]